MFKEDFLKKLNFKNLLISVFIIISIGTIFYWKVEGLNFIDALYLGVTVLTGLGFGETVPHTTIGKLFTILYIFSGVGMMLLFINVLVYKAQQRHPLQALFEKIKDEKEIILEHFHHTEDKKSN